MDWSPIGRDWRIVGVFNANRWPVDNCSLYKHESIWVSDWWKIDRGVLDWRCIGWVMMHWLSGSMATVELVWWAIGKTEIWASACSELARIDVDLGWIGRRFGPRLGRGWLGWKSVGNGLAFEPASGGMKVLCKWWHPQTSPSLQY